MSGELVKYDAACRALAEALATDEVLQIRDEWKAIEAAARVMKNVDVELTAAKIRFRAQRRLGELVAKQRETVGLHKGGRPRKPSGETDSAGESVSVPTLREAGIQPKDSMRAQRLAAVPKEQFDALLAQHETEVRSGKSRVATDLLKINAEEDGRRHRRNLAAALSTTSINLPTGRQYPGGYIDCPWKREGGIGDRAYENHYPTMSWPEILEFLRKARDSFLPDAWAFFWIPRAHLLAPIEIEIEVTVASTGERVLALVEMPLAAACAHALGFDYSTLFVWTKTDADHPDVSGSGLIAWDQDELLLLFKRGRGLPKPSGAEKYGSNHRERATDHSRKPEHYRRMIADMMGCDDAGEPLPVLEMFARVDAEHPLPRNWDACGNQAGAIVINNQDPELAAELPSAAETVTAAAETTMDGASAAAAVTVFSPITELADLIAFRDHVDVSRLDHPEYLRRGLIHDWLGKWRLTPQGEIRINILQRERADRNSLFEARLEKQDFWDWSDLDWLAARLPLDAASVRSLVGLGLAECSEEAVWLTADGLARLVEIEAKVDEPAPALPPLSPYQIDLEDLLRRDGAAA